MSIRKSHFLVPSLGALLLLAAGCETAAARKPLLATPSNQAIAPTLAVLAEDRLGTTFRFSPLQGDLFQATVSEAERRALPDSLVVRTAEGALLSRSTAILYILRGLGGAWRVVAGGVSLVPAPVRDGLYDGVARVRYRLFARPEDACPIVPGELRARFDH